MLTSYPLDLINRRDSNFLSSRLNYISSINRFGGLTIRLDLRGPLHSPLLMTVSSVTSGADGGASDMGILLPNSAFCVMTA